MDFVPNEPWKVPSRLRRTLTLWYGIAGAQYAVWAEYHGRRQTSAGEKGSSSIRVNAIGEILTKDHILYTFRQCNLLMIFI